MTNMQVWLRGFFALILFAFAMPAHAQKQSDEITPEQVQTLVQSMSKDTDATSLISDILARNRDLLRALETMDYESLQQARSRLGDRNVQHTPDLGNPDLNKIFFGKDNALSNQVDLVRKNYPSASSELFGYAVGDILKDVFQGNVIQLYEDIFKGRCQNLHCNCIEQCMEDYAGRVQNAGIDFWIRVYVDDSGATLQDYFDYADTFMEYKLMQLSCASLCTEEDLGSRDSRTRSCREDYQCGRDMFCHKPAIGSAKCKAKRQSGQACIRNAQCASNCCKFRPSIILGIPSKECRPANRC